LTILLTAQRETSTWPLRKAYVDHPTNRGGLRIEKELRLVGRMAWSGSVGKAASDAAGKSLKTLTFKPRDALPGHP
jgi:hypothetical protein